MKNKYIIFLLYLCAGLILAIVFIQINGLSVNPLSAGNITYQMYYQYRSSQTVTLFLAIGSVSVLFARERITRELKRKAYTDVTGIKNKHACLEEMNMLDCRDDTLNIGFAMFDLNNLKKVNDFYGHEKGDELIQSFAALLRKASNKKYFLGRFGGDEFIVIIKNFTEEIMETYISQVRELVEHYNKGRTVPLSFASGYAISTRSHYYLTEDILKEADKDMYRNKRMMKSESLMNPSQLSRILDAERISYLERDNLTGLFNHDAFLLAITKVIAQSDQSQNLALVCSDIANFRYINDTYGHQEGSQILKLFADELSAQPFCLCASRLYSDNFAFLAEFPDIPQESTADKIKEWCFDFSALINKTYRGSRIVINSGIYFIRGEKPSVEAMLNHANTARKHTKTSPFHILVYGDEMARSEKKKAEILNSFHQAIEKREFKVYLQPKVKCSDKSICGAEALIRWEKPYGNLCYPAEFIPVLEGSGDIIELDYYVYEHIFWYLHQQLEKGKTVFPISMNVSRLHLARPHDFISHIRELLEKYDVPASYLLFELTESIYIQEIYSAMIFVDGLHALGIKVSMDDFGSGYSSLELLSNLPFDEIKFDKVFLANSGDDNSRKILIHLMDLVKSMNKTIVCEGVEMQEDVILLDQCDCDIMQGYYYFRPMPLKEFKYPAESAGR